LLLSREGMGEQYVQGSSHDSTAQATSGVGVSVERNSINLKLASSTLIWNTRLMKNSAASFAIHICARSSVDPFAT